MVAYYMYMHVTCTFCEWDNYGIISCVQKSALGMSPSNLRLLSILANFLYLSRYKISCRLPNDVHE